MTSDAGLDDHMTALLCNGLNRLGARYVYMPDRYFGVAAAGRSPGSSFSAPFASGSVFPDAGITMRTTG
jgi:hypothetical protein